MMQRGLERDLWYCRRREATLGSLSSAPPGPVSDPICEEPAPHARVGQVKMGFIQELMRFVSSWKPTVSSQPHTHTHTHTHTQVRTSVLEQITSINSSFFTLRSTGAYLAKLYSSDSQFGAMTPRDGGDLFRSSSDQTPACVIVILFFLPSPTSPI